MLVYHNIHSNLILELSQKTADLFIHLVKQTLGLLFCSFLPLFIYICLPLPVTQKLYYLVNEVSIKTC